MSNTTFPTSIDTPTNPTAANTLASPAHHTQHGLANDAIVALETKVGVDGSAVTTTHDYKLSGVTGSDKAASKTGSETLTNKTLGSGTVINLGSDATGDLYYRNSGGVVTRLPIGTAGQILDVSSGGIPEWVPNSAAADASTSAKGVVEVATQSEADAGTASGGTSAPLVTRTSNIRARNYNDYVADTGSANTYAIAPTPAITAYAVGQIFTFKAVNANTTASTLNVNSLGTKTIKKNVSTDLASGDIAAGQIISVVYDGTNFQLLGSAGSAPLQMWVMRNVQGTPDTNAAGNNATYSAGNVTNGEFVCPFSGFLRNFYVYISANTLSSNAVFTIQVNGVDTALTFTKASGFTGSGSDTTHSVAVSAGDTVKFENGNSPGGTSVSMKSWAVELSSI